MADVPSRRLTLPVLVGPHGALGLAVAAATLALDQGVKIWLLQVFDLGGRGIVPILPFADLVLVWNRGISYGLLQNSAIDGRLLLILVAVAAVVLLGAWLRRERSAAAAVGLGLILGGAIGNALDRGLYGAVVDFMLLHWGSWNWYVFNVADTAIVVGVLLLLYGAVIRGSRTPSADAGGDTGT